MTAARHHDETRPERTPEKAPARLTINLDALVANWRMLGARGPGSECAAVVKANAYGLGLEPVVRALARAGCRTFFVALASEGVTVRETVRDADIFVLGGLSPDNAACLLCHNLRPVLGSSEEIAQWADRGAQTAAALHIDTGMNRLGLEASQAFALAGSLPFPISLVMSHFVAAELPDAAITARQIAAFAELRAAFPGARASLANSAGIFLGAAAHYDLLRPGYAIYGGNPTPGVRNPMRPTLRLEARVLQIRDIPAGASCGYKGLWTAMRPSRLATLAIGYADGLPRGLSSGLNQCGGSAMAEGQLCPIAGLISMDLTVIDITGLPDGALKRGDWVALIDETLDLDTVAQHAGTIGYALLAGLGPRLSTHYSGS